MKRRAGLAGQLLVPGIGFAMLAVTLATGIAIGAFPGWLLAMGGIAIAVVLFGLFRQEGGSLRDSVASIAYSLFVVVSAVFLYLILANHNRTYDLTQHGVYTLSDETRALLSSQSRPVEITAFARPADHPRLMEFFQLYAGESDQIVFRVLDPAADIETARRFDESGVYPGEVFIESGGGGTERRVQRFALDPFDRYRENVLTNNILRLERGGDERICFTRGKGETPIRPLEGRAPNAPDTSCSEIADILQRQLMPVVDVNLSSLSAVPDDAAIVIIAGPKVDFGEIEVEMLREYAAEGGAVLILLDPVARGDFKNLNALAAEAGIALPNQIVLDDTGGKSDASLVPVADAGQHPVLAAGNGAAMPMKFARPVNAAPEQAARVVTASPLLVSSPRSWTKHPLEVYAPNGVTPPPADQRRQETMAVISEWSPERRTRRTTAKFAVFGDSDFVTNQYLGDQSAVLMLRTVEWMTTRDDRLQVPPRILPPSSFTMTHARFWTIIGVLALMSLGLIVAGLTYTTARRRMG